MRNSLFLVLTLLVFRTSYCQTGYDENEIDFSYSAFVGQNLVSPLDSFIVDVRKDGNSSTGLYGIPQVDVGTLFKDQYGKEYLGYLEEYVLDYSNSPDSLLALSVYLKEHYNLKNSIYDQLLRQCIVLDQDYNRAYFLLAELRFKKGGYAEDAYFLMSILKERCPKNSEVKRIYKYLKNRVGGKPLKPDDFKEYLFKDYYYIIED